jgi:hypothetical protein
MSLLAALALLGPPALVARRCDDGARHGSALAGDNLAHFSAASATLCAARCCDNAAHACAAWTFVSWDPYNLPGGDNCTHKGPCCYLKSAASKPYRCPNCTSWSKRGPLPPLRPAPPPAPAPSGPPAPHPLPHPLPNGGGPCASVEDCTLGGVCQGGKCLCDPTWTGAQCAQLHLLPARVGSGYPDDPVNSSHLPTDSTFTWGGAVVEDNGTYHGFFVEWLNHCPMTYGTWSTQTHIRHAVSASRDGPWRPLDVAVPAAAGNPVLSRAPDGTWLLYFTNHRWAGAVRNCTGPVDRWGPPVYCSTTGKQCATGVSLAYSRDLSGPWAIKYDVVSFGATNPGGPIFHSDGSLLMAYKTWTKGGAAMHVDVKCIGMLSARSWKSWPYQRAPGPQCIGVGRNLEDPSNLWRDPRGAIHVLFHQGCGSSSSAGCGSTKGALAAYGGSAGSVDGKTWDYNLTRVAYEYDVAMDDGSVLHCTHREEPKVLLDAAGQPTMLITQCTLAQTLPNTAPTPAFPHGEAQHITRVVMQPINIERKPMAPGVLGPFAVARVKTDDSSTSTQGSYSSHQHKASARPAKHLFVDDSIIANSSGIELVRHRPAKAFLNNGGRVLWPEHPWEMFQGPGTYGGVMKDADGLHRIYYLCRGNSLGDVKTCLATSTDGVNWLKPVLNHVEWNGSKANNIVMPTAWSATGSVFLDDNPAVPPSQRYKFVGNAINPVSPEAKGGSYAIASPDGLGNWTFMTDFPAINKSDTCDVGWWDSSLNAYVIYVRLDKDDKATGAVRRIARTVTPRLDGPWGARQDVFAADDRDPPNMDIYINSATRYAGILVFFPSVYFHFSAAVPQHPWNLTRCSPLGGATNDGIWDSRLVVSRDGVDLHYAGGRNAEARDARAPFAFQGNNRCDFGGSVKDPGGWCNPFDGSYSHTSWDTSMVAFYPGVVESADGESIYLYKWGTAATHHVQGHCPATWGNNSGIGLMTLRMDGWVSADAGYIFRGTAPKSTLPQLTTTPLELPRCPASNRVMLKVNLQTSVVGYLLVELRDPVTGDALAGFSLADADALRGSFISHVYTWQHGVASDIPASNGTIVVNVAMSDASLYALSFVCVG